MARIKCDERLVFLLAHFLVTNQIENHLIMGFMLCSKVIYVHPNP